MEAFVDTELFTNITIYISESKKLIIIKNLSDFVMYVHSKPRDGRRKLRLLYVIEPNSSFCFDQNQPELWMDGHMFSFEKKGSHESNRPD